MEQTLGGADALGALLQTPSQQHLELGVVYHFPTMGLQPSPSAPGARARWCTLNEIFMAVDRKFRPLERLGAGSYGQVYKASRVVRCAGESRYVAIKISPADEQGGIATDVLREFSFLKKLKHLSHPNVVAIIDDDGPGVYHTEKASYIILEHMDMNLRQYLREHGPFAPGKLRAVLVQPLRALHKCHGMSIAHRDFKPQNILVNLSQTGPILKVADFGMARQSFGPSRQSTEVVCTLLYRSPDKLMGCRQNDHDRALDMWSYACVVKEVASTSRRPLFHADCELGCLRQIFQLLGTPTEKVWRGVTRLPRFSAEPVWEGTGLQAIGVEAPALEADGLDLLRELLKINPTLRLTALRALQHPFFAGLGLRGESWVA